MGVVYLAFGPDTNPVALKVLQPALANDEQYRIRFVREVNAARLVESPYVARVMAAETDAEPLWMATEYVEGATLAHAVEANGPVPPDRLRGLASDLASAVLALHNAGLVHRDLKPANVVLAWSGPKLIDFGIAKHESATDLTQSGVTVGSLQWMSPEVLNGAQAGAVQRHLRVGAVRRLRGHRPGAVRHRQPDGGGLPDRERAARPARAFARSRPARGRQPGQEPGRPPDGPGHRPRPRGTRGPQATAVAVPRPEGGWTGPNPASPLETASAAPPPPPYTPPPYTPPYSVTPPPYAGTPPPAYPPTRPVEYSPRPAYQGPPERRRSTRPGWLLPVVAMGVLVIAAAIAITILATSNNGSTPAAHKSTQPHVNTADAEHQHVADPPSPSPTTSPSGNAQLQAATALDSLLTDSSRNRANVVAAVASVASCQDPAGAAATLTQAANDRQAELNRLQTLDLSALSGSNQLVGALTSSLDHSQAADQAFAAWAQASEGCSGNAAQDSNYAAASDASTAATASKQQFVNLWNPIARRFGLTVRKPSDI